LFHGDKAAAIIDPDEKIEGDKTPPKDEQLVRQPRQSPQSSNGLRLKRGERVFVHFHRDASSKSALTDFVHYVRYSLCEVFFTVRTLTSV
jgi:hypothetical protein